MHASCTRSGRIVRCEATHELASLVTKCCPSFFDAVDRPSRVFWIGLLFGLGLDTATEIALLTTTAIALPDVPYLSALVLPLLFAAGMALIDSLNAVLMLWAQEWAADEGPMHRLYFSLFLTLASAALALSIGLIEAFGQLASIPWLVDRSPAVLAPFWQASRWLSDHLELLESARSPPFSSASCSPSPLRIDACRRGRRASKNSRASCASRS